MKKSDFYYDLPEELIAQRPLENREDSRLLVIPRNGGEFVHTQFKSILEFLRKDDCLVFNDSRVIFARLIGTKKSTGAKVEFLLLREKDRDTWESLVKPGKKANIGDFFVFGDDGLLTGEIIKKTPSGGRIVKFKYSGDFLSILKEKGKIPLPPYIKEELNDPERYQTVYSKKEGSVAAPTAGLHFTEEILEKVKDAGIKTAFITLHVGLGTFRPVKTEDIKDHKMHQEYYEISEEAANTINSSKRAGGRIIAVGTTSVRTLESQIKKGENGLIKPGWDWTEIFIYPGYQFGIVDGLITNFHLPESTLIMLVSAFAGRERILNAYNEAVQKRYRFFSFGDAMLIL